MSTKEIGEIKVILSEIGASVKHIKESVDDLKKDYKTLNIEVTNMKQEVAAVKSSYSLLKWFVGSTFLIAGGAGAKVIFDMIVRGAS